MIQIETVNFFGQSTGTDEYNAKVLYKKYSKMYLAHIYIDYFNKRVYISKQPKEGKALTGLEGALNKKIWG